MDFEVVGTRGFFRPSDRMSFEQAMDLVCAAAKYARQLELSDLVINTLRLTGFKVPRVFDRYALMTRILESAGVAMRIVMVARPELIDFQKIGVLIYQNRGGISDIFGTEAEALAWLDAGRAPRDRLPDIGDDIPHGG